MTKHLCAILAAIAAMLFVAIQSGAGDRIAVTNFGEMERVIFDHDWHADELGCETCHHPRELGRSHRCGRCHQAEAEGPVIKLEDAAHKEGVGRCWKCHLAKGARKSLECEDCHRG